MSPNPPTSSNENKKINLTSSNATNPALYHNVQNYIKELEISEGQLSSVLKYKYF